MFPLQSLDFAKNVKLREGVLTSTIPVGHWMTVAFTSMVPNNIQYGTCILTYENAGVASGFENSAARVNGNEIQIKLPKFPDGKIIIVDISWLG